MIKLNRNLKQALIHRIILFNKKSEKKCWERFFQAYE